MGIGEGLGIREGLGIIGEGLREGVGIGVGLGIGERLGEGEGRGKSALSSLLVAIFFAMGSNPKARCSGLHAHTSHANNHHRLFLHIIIFNDSPSSCFPSSSIQIGGSIEVEPNAFAHNTTVEVTVQFTSVLILLPLSQPPLPLSHPSPFPVFLFSFSLFSLLSDLSK